MVEMARDEWDVDVAALANWLAVIHRLKHREQAGMLLDQARESIKIASASMRSQSAPLRRSSSSGLHCGIDVSGAALSDAREFLAGRRIQSVEIFFPRRRLPRSADEQLKLALVAIEPCCRFF